MTGIQLFQVYSEADKTPTSNKMGNQWVDFYNSAFLSGTNPLQVYHKSKLVVGIETLPYKQIIEPLFGNICLIWVVQFAVVQWILIEKYLN
ncbi:MAG: hypothetical protein CM15mP32_3890 [Flavobacteriaceae bacterium]|nr:MAG: hypothetical protein CM15mP32_3890 [Flavobacteriaceae bacterium]